MIDKKPFDSFFLNTHNLLKVIPQKQWGFYTLVKGGLNLNRIVYGNKMAENFITFPSNSHLKNKTLVLHRATRKRSPENQYIRWVLHRYPLSQELRLLKQFFKKKGFSYSVENNRRIQCRSFFEDGTSMHASIWKKEYGVNIDLHIDRREHGENVFFTKDTLGILSELYVYLKKAKKIAFMLLRQKLDFQGYISNF